MLRTARPALFTLLAVGASLAAAASARADVASTNVCDGKAFDCRSNGATSLHAESRAPIMSSIGTGWSPACAAPDANGHCNEEAIQVAVSIDLAALRAPSTEPLWSVSMLRTAVVSAAWPSAKEFELTIPTAATTDGVFKVSHTLVPAARVYANILGFKREWMYDASRFITENAASFDYKATNTVTFAPWAFDQPTINKVPAPALTTTALFSTKLVNNADNDVDLALSATTSPTFSYRTTKVSIAGASPISAAAKTGRLPMRDADYLELTADVEGEIAVTGELIAAPYVAINRIAGIKVPLGLGVLDLTNALNAPKQSYAAAPPAPVKFPGVTVRIPLANVKVAASLDLGAVMVGQSIEKPITIGNTGELAAKMLLVSSDPQFSVDATAAATAKGSATVNVRFTAAKEGPQTATITVRSNDPDSPVQTLTVHASGSLVPVPVSPPAETPTEEPAAPPVTDSGCGCHTAAPAGTPYGAAFAGLGLALGLVVRRRRQGNAPR